MRHGWVRRRPRRPAASGRRRVARHASLADQARLRRGVDQDGCGAEAAAVTSRVAGGCGGGGRFFGILLRCGVVGGTWRLTGPPWQGAGPCGGAWMSCSCPCGRMQPALDAGPRHCHVRPHAIQRDGSGPAWADRAERTCPGRVRPASGMAEAPGRRRDRAAMTRTEGPDKAHHGMSMPAASWCGRRCRAARGGAGAGRRDHPRQAAPRSGSIRQIRRRRPEQDP